MTIKQLSIKNVVDGRNVVGTEQYRKRKTLTSEQAPNSIGGIHIHRDQLQAQSCPPGVNLLKCLRVFQAVRRLRGPQIQQHRLAAELQQRAGCSRKIGKRKLGSRNRRQKPAFHRCRQNLALAGRFHDCGSRAMPPWARLHTRGRRAFLHPNPVIDRKVVLCDVARHLQRRVLRRIARICGRRSRGLSAGRPCLDPLNGSAHRWVLERRALLRLLVLRERGRPRRTIVWLSTDRPHQPPAATPQKMLTVMADNELAAATYPVDLAAPVPVHELSERSTVATGSPCLMVARE